MRQHIVEGHAQRARVERVHMEKPGPFIRDQLFNVGFVPRGLHEPCVGVDSDVVTLIEVAYELSAGVQAAASDFQDPRRRHASFTLENLELQLPAHLVGVDITPGERRVAHHRTNDLSDLPGDSYFSERHERPFAERHRVGRTWRGLWRRPVNVGPGWIIGIHDGELQKRRHPSCLCRATPVADSPGAPRLWWMRTDLPASRVGTL